MYKYNLLLILTVLWNSATAQTNYLDNYLSNPVTLATVGSSVNQVSQPRDLDFKPNSNELWICNYGNASGGSNVIFYNAGLPNQTSEYRKDTHTAHFMRFPSAMAFGDEGEWAAVSEIQNTNSGTFMGPALWSGDTSIMARVFQNNWLNGFPLGSHLDMLHQSPFAMGIAHDSLSSYWVMDGHFGNICKYDFAGDHGPGHDNHSNGKIWRYSDVTVARVAGIPSHMVMDKENHWLYYIDGVSKTIKRMNTWSGIHSGNLTAPNEPLALYWNMTGATVEIIDTLATQPCGIDYYNGRLIVSDHTTGDIYIYNTTGAITLMGTISTGQPGIMGIKVGPDGRIWYVNHTNNTVIRLDPGSPVTDAAILEITSPGVENWMPSFYSTSFNVCANNVTPAILVSNSGSASITSLEIQYTIDGGSPIPFPWTGTLAPGASTSILLPGSAVVNGSHLLSVNIISVNGSPDEIDLNNTITGSFRVVDPPAPLPFLEEFIPATFPPAEWHYIHFNPDNSMTRVTAGGFGLSTGSLKMNHYSGQVDITGQQDHLMLPLIDFTNGNTNTYLRFNIAYAKYNASSNERLQVFVSADCGMTWSAIYDKAGTTLSTAPVTTGAFTPSASQWRRDSVSMLAYSGQAELMMLFTTTSNFGNNMYLDDIFIGDITTGIEEISLIESLNINPNPVSSLLHVNFEKELQEIANGKIYSSDGKLVTAFSISKNLSAIDLDVSDLNPGVYFLKMSIGNKVSSKSFIKLGIPSE